MNKKGISLVETTVALGVMAILALAVSSMISNQQKESRSVSESLAKLDLEKLLIASLASGEICTFELTQPSPKTFDSTAISGSTPPTITLTGLHASAIASAPLLVQTGTKASPASSSLIVNSIVIGNIVGAGTPDSFLADLKIDFDPTKTVRVLKPISLKMTLNTDPTSPAKNKKITGCLRDPGSGDLWTLTPDNSGNIYYNSGKVAVGTVNPLATLDVNGGVKISYDSGACNAAREGTLRYNSAPKVLEVCNGTVWQGPPAPAPAPAPTPTPVPVPVPVPVPTPPSCVPGPPVVFTTFPTYTDACGKNYTLAPGCYTSSGNQVASSCLKSGGGQFRISQSGSGCGPGQGCNAFSGAPGFTGNDLPCGLCYKKFTNP